MNSRITVTPVKTIIAPKLSLNGPVKKETSSSLDLVGVRETMGKLWLPTYIPPGYELKNTNVKKERAVYLFFDNLSLKSNLTILETPNLVKLNIPPEKHRPVNVHGQTGILVLGMWMQSITATSNEPANWSDEVCLELFYEIEGWVIRLLGTPAKAWSEQELIKIAESMTQYKE
jgi:hypothetical protein